MQYFLIFLLIFTTTVTSGFPTKFNSKKPENSTSYTSETIENVLLSDNITEGIGSSQEVEVIAGNYSGNETKPRITRRYHGGHHHYLHHHIGGYHIGGYGFHHMHHMHHHHSYSSYSPSYYYSYYSTPSYDYSYYYPNYYGYGNYGYNNYGYSNYGYNNYYGYNNCQNNYYYGCSSSSYYKAK